MKVLLNKDVSKLGYRGDIVRVKDGYFRNFLYPKKLATIATEALVAIAEKRREKIVVEKQRLLENIKEVVAKVDGLKVEIAAKVTAKETLYRAISAKDVVKAVLDAKNVKLEDQYVKFDEHIKTLGKHDVVIDFGDGNKATVKLTVVKAEK